MTKLIQADFNGQAMQFTQDAWFNATEAAVKFGKRPVDWLNQDGTQEYIATLADMLKCEPGSLLKTKRGNNGGTWMHPKLAVRFAQWLDARFAVWCDMQIDALIRGQSKPDDWSAARVAAASNHRLLCDMVNLHRQAIGKNSAAHHYANEARLINWVFSGQFSPINRDVLSVPELRLLELLERQDAVLLGMGKSYDERKAALLTFANEQRQRLALPANDTRRLTA
ncbi:DNA-binding protein [Chromobacterium sp. ATCC 53434]|uniref:DNA-binding protein n=1 Tax=Chromobacterium amazonense TaxID=1382803 RepID=A0A2S9X8G6_9NEIS|nr:MULTISPECIES: KilA-N domain-containing protein [Chromobacterium]AUH49542.1 DNA-binding protein [Chromobacterium sp. ATCC 53434]PRP71966.1 DNA-binding protein [Chromobacterium amazonense]